MCIRYYSYRLFTSCPCQLPASHHH